MRHPLDHDPRDYRTNTLTSQRAVAGRLMARHMREEHGMSLSAIQKALGVSRATLKDWLA